MPAKQKVDQPEPFARVRVVGVGGSGGNAVNYMTKSNLRGVEFIVANTDSQDLKESLAKKKIHLGQTLTRGLGTGMNPDLGREAAEASADDIKRSLKGADMVFITGGMGGGTGTGAAPVVASMAKELGALVVAVVTQPFSFEGHLRMKLAKEGTEQLKSNVDSIIVIPNENLVTLADKSTTMEESFSKSDDVLFRAVRGISDLVTRPGYINTDFADVCTIMSKSGTAVMGIGSGSGPDRAQQALKEAIESPVVGMPIKGAKRALFSITSRTAKDIAMLEINEISEQIADLLHEDARIIFGTVLDPSLKSGEIRVTVIATAIDTEIMPTKPGDITEKDSVSLNPENDEDDMTIIGESLPEEEFDDVEEEEDKISSPKRGLGKLWNK